MLATGTSSRSSQFTACSSTDFKGNNFKALVYEFMTNGSLDNWLNPNPYDQGNERNLTLFQRQNIAIDVALAVDYLHHQSLTKIIHCDIKPSNIFLDEEVVAHVSDFGLARFFITTEDKIKHKQVQLVFEELLDTLPQSMEWVGRSLQRGMCTAMEFFY